MLLAGLIMIGIFMVLLFYLPLMYCAKTALILLYSGNSNIVAKITVSIFVYAFMLLLTVFSIAMIAFIIL